MKMISRMLTGMTRRTTTKTKMTIARRINARNQNQKENKSKKTA